MINIHSTVGQVVTTQKSAPHDSSKPLDVNTCTSIIRAPLQTTHNSLHPCPKDMGHIFLTIMCPQMMAVPNDPCRKSMVLGDPRQRHCFDMNQ